MTNYRIVKDNLFLERFILEEEYIYPGTGSGFEWRRVAEFHSLADAQLAKNKLETQGRYTVIDGDSIN